MCQKAVMVIVAERQKSEAEIVSQRQKAESDRAAAIKSLKAQGVSDDIILRAFGEQ
jgi:hypothetical protein